jgi:hypothetical protein
MTAEYPAFENRIARAFSAVVLDKIAEHVKGSTLSGTQITALLAQIARRRKALYESGEVHAEQVRDEFLHDEKTRGDGHYDDCGCDYPDWHSQGGEVASAENHRPTGGNAGQVVKPEGLHAAQSPPPTTLMDLFPKGENMNPTETDKAKAGTKVEVVSEGISSEIMASALAQVRKQDREAKGIAKDALAELPVALTPADMERMADLAIARVKAFERVKKAILREGHHYIIACYSHPAQAKDEKTGRRAPYLNHDKRPGGKDCGEGQVMMKKNGSDALGNGFGVSVLPLSDTIIRDKEDKPIKAVVEIFAEWQRTRRFGRGTCTMDELKTEKTEHNMHEKAQTRAEKRGILAVLGSADPIADE